MFSIAMSTATLCNAQVNIGAPSAGYTFFNKPGATISEHNQDLSDCARAAGSVRSYSEAYPLSPVGLRAIEGMITQGWTDAVHLAALEDCMIVRGWRVVRLDDQQGETLGALGKSDLAARLSEMVGAAAPAGNVVRQWSNDVARADNDRYSMRPDA